MMKQLSKSFVVLSVLAVISSLLYGWLLYLGPSYSLATDIKDRPLLLVIGIYVSASLVYLLALQIAIKMPSTRWMIGFVIVTSLWFRALVLPTPPFQEIDLYRYLWDGAMTANRLDPYSVAPQQIVDQLDGKIETSSSNDIERRIEIIEANPALDPIVRTIHYADLPSPYPPVSQAIFAASHLTTAKDWPVRARIQWLKVWLTLFDLATLLLILRLLTRTGLPLGWAIAYGWCPLVLKEFAGSGHLDSIAIFFTTAALVAAVETFASLGKQATDKRVTTFCLLAATLLAFGVGAKLYPVILAPLLAITFLRRFGWQVASTATFLFMAISVLTLMPMLLPATNVEQPMPLQADPIAVQLPAPPESFPLSESDANGDIHFKSSGIRAFLKQWEMNDLLFMLLYENLRSQQNTSQEALPWFDLTPESWSTDNWRRQPNAFFLSRAITLVLFVMIALVLAIGASRSETASTDWLRAAFLTIAWFWLLAPTQNPWYWCWALPLLPFVRSAAWRWFAVALFAYYLRFWLETHATEVGFLGTPYDGDYFFYYVITWLEHGPLLAWLAIESVISLIRPNVLSLTDSTSSNV